MYKDKPQQWVLMLWLINAYYTHIILIKVFTAFSNKIRFSVWCWRIRWFITYLSHNLIRNIYMYIGIYVFCSSKIFWWHLHTVLWRHHNLEILYIRWFTDLCPPEVGMLVHCDLMILFSKILQANKMYLFSFVLNQGNMTANHCKINLNKQVNQQLLMQRANKCLSWKQFKIFPKLKTFKNWGENNFDRWRMS